MNIWVDADACPAVIRDILFRAALRTGVQLTLVANHHLRVPSAPNIRSQQVAPGFDVADNIIVQQLTAGDLVITSDIPLADEVLSAGGMALSPRGEQFDAGTIKAKLNMRDFMETLRGSGIHTGGPAALGASERKAFGGALDRILARQSKPA